VSEKEKELVSLLAAGYVVRETAKLLHINKKTCEAFVFDVRKKYHAKTLAELVAIFLRNKLIK